MKNAERLEKEREYELAEKWRQLTQGVPASIVAKAMKVVGINVPEAHVTSKGLMRAQYIRAGIDERAWFASEVRAATRVWQEARDKKRSAKLKTMVPTVHPPLQLELEDELVARVRRWFNKQLAKPTFAIVGSEFHIKFVQAVEQYMRAPSERRAQLKLLEIEPHHIEGDLPDANGGVKHAKGTR